MSKSQKSDQLNRSAQMETTHAQGHRPTAKPASPRLIRCRSGAPAISTPEKNPLMSTGKRFVCRSKSTTRSRNAKSEEENIDPSTIVSGVQKIRRPDPDPDPDHDQGNGNCKDRKNGFVRFLQSGQGSPRVNNYSGRKGVNSATKSPSAWALSPGRSSPCLLSVGSPVSSKATVKNVGGASGVLKYFRQKKVSAVQEEEYHRFRVLHNRLLQWRFVNGRTEATMSAMNITAKGKLFGGCVRIWKLRNLILEKRIQVEKLKHEIKLRDIMRLELPLLHEWSKIDGKNYEAVSRMSRKLSASMFRLPLVHGARGDVNSIYEAMSMAVEIMDSIQAIITSKFFSKVEKILYLVTEMTSMMEQKEECGKEVENIIACFPSLLTEESSLRVHHMQQLKS